jgi:hypothetical protein
MCNYVLPCSFQDRSTAEVGLAFAAKVRILPTHCRAPSEEKTQDLLSVEPAF